MAKDTVFIIWSGEYETGEKVVDRLGFEEYTGKIVNDEHFNEINRITIGDSVIGQIDSCNQTIAVFQKKDDGKVSNNLLFELGYCFAKHGLDKVFCYVDKNDPVDLPSDLEGALIVNIEGGDGFADRIVDDFIKRQRTAVETSKIELMNRRHRTRTMLENHCSDEHYSNCSDYELAQYLLVYPMAAEWFDDMGNVQEQIRSFANNSGKFSDELKMSVDLALAYFNFNTEVKMTENEEEAYVECDDANLTWLENAYGKLCEKNPFSTGDGQMMFEKWALVMVSETLEYLYMLLASKPDEDEDIAVDYLRKSFAMAGECYGFVNLLCGYESIRKNGDNNGFLAIIRSYLDRDNYVCMKKMQQLAPDDDLAKTYGGKDRIEWLRDANTEIEKIITPSNRGTFDTAMIRTAETISCLILTELIEEGAEKCSSKNLKTLNKHLSTVDRISNNPYVGKIKKFYDENKKQ